MVSRRPKLLRQLTRESGDIDLQVVRAEKTGARRAPAGAGGPPPTGNSMPSPPASRGGGSAECAADAIHRPARAGLLFFARGGPARAVSGRGPVLFAGAASALAWDYFFLPPRFTFIIQSTEDGILFGLYFVVAIVLGQLVARIRAGTGRTPARGTRHRVVSTDPRTRPGRHAR
jgi:two-component system, OmpR family, sensor histidine kinase KdpD